MLNVGERKPFTHRLKLRFLALLLPNIHMLRGGMGQREYQMTGALFFYVAWLVFEQVHFFIEVIQYLIIFFASHFTSN
ncbi:hypothetical protein BA894_19595 [Vibrio natriegens]|nr:hypothetical protein BA894_19595 [Vibrio natriegens]